MTEPILDLRGLVTEFRTETGIVRAVKGVDLSIGPGETVALVGESGSGKSVTSLSIMRLIPERIGGITAGQVLFRGPTGTRDLATLSQIEMSAIRGAQISMIFQEPMTSLNPAQKVGAQIAEAARLHQGLTPAQGRARAIEMMRLVEIPDPESRANAWPHQLSGGMRQRVMIAMALVCNPSLLIADEPTTALDSTVQLQILALLKRLQAEFGMGILFVTHNFGVVAEIADRVAVMYGGRIVETAEVADLFDAPRHPYTRGLLASLPGAATGLTRLPAIPGSVVDPRHPPPGCDFAPRCAHVQPRCQAAVPVLETAAPGHLTRCLRWRELYA
jgi:peptide/nickel transport system ATP-binding protein